MPKPSFQPGNPGGPGRPRGSRNRLSESFLEALYNDFQTNGEAAIEAARAESPLGYVKLIAALLPHRVELNRGVAALSDDELLAIVHAEAAKAPDSGPLH